MLGVTSSVSSLAVLTLSANQTTNLNTGDKIAFDTIFSTSGWIKMTAGTVTLNGPGRYLLQANPQQRGSAANAVTQWYDVTNSSFTGKKQYSPGYTITGLNSLVFFAVAFINLTTSSPKQVELRIQMGGGTGTAWTTNTWAFIHRL